MANPSTLEFFEALYGDPMPRGRLAIYTTTLSGGNDHTYWCYHPPQADRLCQRFRNTRQVRAGAALQSQETALAVARERRKRARPGTIRGCAASVTAMPALWAVIPWGPPASRAGAAPAPLPAGLQQALGLLEAVDQRPSIVISTSGATGGAVYAFWRLRRPWAFDLQQAAAEQAAATALLARLQGAIERLAAERGLRLGVKPDIAASFPLPDFPTGARAGGPRAALEVFPLLPGDGLCRRRDFESLPDPPAPDPQPWQDFFAPAPAPEPRLHDFLPVADGCSWIRACRAERATLSRRQLGKAIRLLAECQTPGADSRRLVHAVAGGHPGYDAAEVDRLLARASRERRGSITCAEIGKEPGVVDRHCSQCPDFGLIAAPVDLARRHGAANDEAAEAPPLPSDRSAAPAPAAAVAATRRQRIVITSRRHEVNDQALAALAAGADLFERRGTLVELVRYPGAAPAGRRIGEARLEELLSRHCEFVVEPGAEGSPPRDAPPPRWTTRGLLARGRWPELPQLAPPKEATAPGPPTPAETADRPGSSRFDPLCQELLEALEPVLAALGGTATARSLARALAGEPERFGALAAVFERLAPGLDPGHPQAPAALGYRLRAFKGRTHAGRALIEAGRTRDGIAWGLAESAHAADPTTDPLTQGGSHAMNLEELWDSPGPSTADLKALERIARHRRAFGGVKPEGEHQVTVRERLLRRLDDMEELVCEEGSSASTLAEAWQGVDELEALYWQDAAGEETAPAAADRGPEEPVETAPAANDLVAHRRAA